MRMLKCMDRSALTGRTSTITEAEVEQFFENEPINIVTNVETTEHFIAILEDPDNGRNIFFS